MTAEELQEEITIALKLLEEARKYLNIKPDSEDGWSKLTDEWIKRNKK